MKSANPLALVAGAGAGLGQSLLSRFQAGGMTAVGLGRSRPENPVGTFHELDLSDPEAVGPTIADLIATYGPPKIVVHNTAELVIAPFPETTLKDYQRAWTSMVQSLVVLGQCVLQPMVRGGGGTLIVSGATASLRGGPRFSAFASAKFALLGLTQSLAREYQPAGVHVAHVILDGIIDTPRSRDLHSLDPAKMIKPDEIAETYWQLAHQPQSTWTHELDLRPASEGF
ncbi:MULTISPECIES: SDR family NAD(P)-dependent oxidoreductase [unclassified Ruegeria]|uniref:SDR family NAD(P)-dependent oxidoreductase n=1 Tax=unclassified Ruegeria TaxID=2625375 RepID=UPI0014930184|nr:MULTISPECIES: SDR family NAD(P)-dependent oxidoreductase [unclassified Ruegeria]NOD47793.1 SDR family NAD(P)-dependent oxidoreductase [Ruegeria sp. HKCCD5849]NOD52544.1 SDR family NAD(P)-dependent oxidoreductase [Ruegeria sp. HKCCD5851]NOD65963.1 SDR family NAD(P)-dependent oxidoreductase [Ruegeria sp. HKCCD7303]